VREARKILVDQAASTLVTIAKDAKIQVEFNPAVVGAFRLVGYEDRLLAKQDFNDDAKDAGEVGAGHVVTALYEVVPAGRTVDVPRVDPLRYGIVSPKAATPPDREAETLVVKLRWKEPDGVVSKKAEVPFVDRGASFDAASVDFRFAAAVAEFGMCLTGSPHKGGAVLAEARRIARAAIGDDPGGWRAEMVGLVQKAESLPPRAAK
jgi:Ca-activated chloride channel family protein